jgi:hypothetical protein
MTKADLFMEIVATYRKHGWELKSALLRPETQAELSAAENVFMEKLPVTESAVNALWFSRPSNNNREAWELRLLAENQYALFETFEPDETAEERQEARLEMEARLREKILGGN